MTLPQIFGITLENNIKKGLPGIPFTNKVGNNLNFYVNVKKSLISDNPSEEECLEQATTYFIEHYFPEYYALVVDLQNEEFSSFRTDYEELRSLLYNALSYTRTTRKNTIRTYQLFFSDRDVYDIRDQYEVEGKLPEFSQALQFFNTQRSVTESQDATSFEFINQPSILDQLGGTLGGLTAALSAFPGMVPLDLDANTLETSVNRIINRLLDVVYESMEIKLQPSNFYDSDYVTMYFDSNSMITQIDYFVLGANRGETKTAKIAFFTNSKYNPLFRSTIALATLKNYKSLIEGSQERSNLTQQQSITDFFSKLGLEGENSFTQPRIGDIPGSLTPGNNLFGNRTSDDLIDISTFDELANKFNTIKTKEDLLVELQAAENETIKKNILQNEKAKKLNAGIQVLDTIDNILNFNIPLAGPNATKEQKIFNQILNQFGIQAIAKEAIICLTLGLGATASRITQAVRNSIVDAGSSLRREPTPPSKELGLRRPNLKKYLDLPDPFSVTGDIHKQIKDIILGALANGAFEVIKSLAEMVRFNCDALLRGEVGTIDLGDRLRNENNRAANTFPNLEDLLANEFAQAGLTMEDLYGYFTDVSAILDPIEICRLLNSQNAVENSTYNNILQFNSTYSLAAIRQITTVGAVNSYFLRMSKYVDTVTLCNDIINNNVLSVIENCEICLSADFFDGNPALQQLIDIAENGVQVEPPIPEFLCPDSPNYLENPVATTILPNLFNNILDTTKIYLAGSVEAARTTLLEPTVSSEVDSQLSGAFNAAGVELPHGELDTGPLNFITGLFEFFDNATQIVADAENTGVCQDIDNAKLQMVVDNINDITQVVNDALAEVPGVIEEIEGKVTQLQEQGGPGIAHTKYVFPEAFRRRFESAVRYLQYASPAANGPGALQLRGDPSGLYPSQINSSFYTNLPSTPEPYDGFQYALSFAPNQYLRIHYPPYALNEQNYLTAEYDLSNIDDGLQGSVNDFVPNNLSEIPADDGYQDAGLNPYVYRFAAPVLSHNNIAFPAPAASITEVVGDQFSSVYTSLYEKLFGYVLENGAFSANKVNNLRFFKNNDLCEPENVGDLFDTGGIMDQMKKEFAMAACFDGGTAKDKARNTVYHGLMLMLIQTAIDEFIIKNIVVFSAFDVESLWELPMIQHFAITEVVKAVANATTDGDPIFERELYNYFERLSLRQSTLNNGGIAHTFPPYTIPEGFELNDAGTQANFPSNNTDLIRFLVEERLFYTWDNGQRSTLQAINNILDPEGQNKNFDEVFLEDVIGVRLTATSAGWQNYTRESSADVNGDSVIFINKEFSTETSLVYVKWGSATNSATVDYRVNLIDIPYPADWLNLSYEDRRRNTIAAIQNNEEYQIFKTQVFSQDAIMLGAILYNFHLTNTFFSDISDSFTGTKKAILNFMNMTDASQRPPAPDLPNNEFTNTIANNGAQGLDSLAREIFLTFLRETPIAILKGLVELIDPHVAISKIIKDVTGNAFIELSRGITTSINAQPEESPLRAGNIDGDDILAFLFCLYNINNTTASNLAIPANGEGDLLFGPRIELEGVDFKGSIAGMLMAPPSPLGILYLLIELLRLKLEEGGGVEDATEPPPPEQC